MADPITEPYLGKIELIIIAIVVGIISILAFGFIVYKKCCGAPRDNTYEGQTDEIEDI